MKNSAVRCSDCGSSKATVKKGTYRFAECGLDTVVLKGIELIECPECGTVDPVIPHLTELLRVLALAIVAKPMPLTGPEVRYLRKYASMNGERFARMLHTDKTTLSKWENGATKIGSKTDLLIRAITLQIGPGLKEEAEQVIRQFASIDEKATEQPSRLEVDSGTLQYAYA
jgi:putative zinc finger/helix-turn-helix YgiT family protein